MTDDDRSRAGPADDDADDVDDHLAGVADGCGCAEVWEHLSERREASAEADAER